MNLSAIFPSTEAAAVVGQCISYALIKIAQ